ncbi:MotA/TolQ/ExbB proton channel family protein [Spongorhabdus nitratireducens]
MLPDAFSLHEFRFLLGQFFQSGGWVLYPIFAVTILMLALILERVIYRAFNFSTARKDLLAALATEPLREKKRSLVCELDLELKSHFTMIKTLITLCPLIGLLGTVTGMVQVFDSLAHYGTANPRLMAAGVASATFPTMTGMAIAVTGLLFHNRLSRWADSESQKLRQHLNRDQDLNRDREVQR